AEIHASINHRRGTVNLEPCFKVPNQRAVPGVEAIDVVVQPARNYSIARECRSSFETILRLVFPDNCTVVNVNAIHVSIGRGEVNSITGNRRLAGPRGAAPPIFMQTATNQ